MKAKPHAPALKTALLYAALAAAWIVLSDAFNMWLSSHPVEEWLRDTSKGLSFVAVSSLLLYGLLKRYYGRLTTSEEQLRASEEWWRYAVQNAGHGVWDWSAENDRVFYSKQWKSMLGFQETEISESHGEWLERLHPEDRPRVEEMMRLHMEGRSPAYTCEYRMRTKQGDWKWILARGQVTERSADGKPLRAIGTQTDITRLKEAEQELKTSQQRTADALAFAKAILSSSPMGILTYGPDGRTVSANEAAARIVGCAVADLLRQNYRELESWRRSGMLASAERALSENKAIVHTGPVHTTFGKSLWVEAHFVPFDHMGERHLLLILVDDTEKRRALEGLELLQATVQAAPVGWVVTDAAGTIQSVNPAFTQLTGYTAEEVVGLNPRVLKSGRHPAEFYAGMWRTLTAGAVWSGELINRRKDGKEYREHMTIAPVRNAEGAIAHFVAVKQDITERRQLEQQLARAQRLESIGLLASGIAHDLNNIFSPILLSLEMLKMKYPTSDGRRMVELVESAGLRGAGIVRQVLTFARGLEGERTEVNPRYLVKEAAQIFSETLPRHIQIETDVAADVPNVRGDATQLHQVLLNLAINARDAMPNGGRLLLGAKAVETDGAHAATNRELKPGRWVVLTVRDTGCGMTPEVMEHIFEPFFTTKPLGQGTGLGLSTVYGIVKSHGGVAEVSSEVGRGTEFRIWLPALGRPDAETAAGPDSKGAASLRGNGRCVLVVDDEEPIRLITRAALERHGFVVETACDGAEGWSLFQAKPRRYAAAVVDLMMPRMDGRHLVRQMRTLAPDLPVIFSSGLTDDKGGSSPPLGFEALGVKTLLRKPYTEAQLLAALGSILAGVPRVEKKV